jgi:hypothetical protein
MCIYVLNCIKHKYIRSSCLLTWTETINDNIIIIDTLIRKCHPKNDIVIKPPKLFPYSYIKSSLWWKLPIYALLRCTQQKSICPVLTSMPSFKDTFYTSEVVVIEVRTKHLIFTRQNFFVGCTVVMRKSVAFTIKSSWYSYREITLGVWLRCHFWGDTF